MAQHAAQDHRGLAARYWRVMEPQALDVLRRVFHQGNRAMVLLWRLGLGSMADVWPEGFGRLLVIEHTGRRSGSRYRTPLNYTIVGDDLYCVAAFGERTDWYRNLLATPNTAVWLPNGRWEASVTDVSDDPNRVDLLRKVLIDSGFAAPLFGIHPRHIGDEHLAETTATYRLVQVRPLRRQEAPDGPGDLTWIWYPTGAAIAFCLLARRSGSGRVARRTQHEGQPEAVRARDSRRAHVPGDRLGTEPLDISVRPHSNHRQIDDERRREDR